MTEPELASETALKAPRSRAGRLAWGAGLLVTVALGAGTAYEFSPQFASATAVAAAPPSAMPVSVAEVAQRDTAVWADFSGRLEAVGQVEIRPRVPGAVIAAHFREGALVKKGDLLFTIDPAPYQAEMQSAEAEVAAAAAHLVLAAREQQRGLALVGSGATPQAEVDQRVNEFHAAEANLRDKQAALDVTKLNLDWTEVRAPIAGRVGRIEVTPGNLVAAGPSAPVLTTLVSVDPIYASFDADEHSVEQALATLPGSQDVNSEIGLIPVQMGTLAEDGTPLQGKLQLIDNLVDRGSGTVRVRAVFNNADGRLMPGQFARLRMGEARTAPTIAIDENAIGTDQDRRFVMVVGSDSRAVYRQVQLGPVIDGQRVITHGLSAGERIVVGGLQRIGPGSLVAPHIVAMTPSHDASLPSG
jgi:membrane fusion protein, multidrug efflux system